MEEDTQPRDSGDVRLEQLFERFEERIGAIVTVLDLKAKEVLASEGRLAGAVEAMHRDLRELKLTLKAQETENIARFKRLSDEIMRAHKRVDDHAALLTQMRADIVTLQSADQRRSTEWNAEKDNVLQAMKQHVAVAVNAALLPAHAKLSEGVAAFARLEQGGTIGSINHLISLLDPENVALLKAATDEQIAARVQTKKKQESLADITANTQITEQKLKPWTARASLVQLLITVLLMVAAFAGFDTCRQRAATPVPVTSSRRGVE